MKRDVTLDREEGCGLKKGCRGDVALRKGEGGGASLFRRAGPVGGGARGKSSPQKFCDDGLHVDFGYFSLFLYEFRIFQIFTAGLQDI